MGNELNLEQDKLDKIFREAKALEHASEDKIYGVLLKYYRQGKIRGMESLAEKLELNVNIQDD